MKDMASPVHLESQQLEPHPSEPQWTLADFGLLLGALIPCFGVGAIVVSVGRAIAPETFSIPAVGALVFQVTIYLFVMLVLYALTSIRHGMPMWQALGWTMRFRGAGLCAVAGPPLAIAAGQLSALLGDPATPNPVDELISGRASLAVVGVFAVFLGPLLEELVFRGFLFSLIRRMAGAWPAVLGAALLFSLLHGAQYSWAWQILVPLVLVGTVFGLARHWTGSTAAAVLVHSSYNLTLFIAEVIRRWAAGDFNGGV